jgi:hypothetical protein
MPPLLPLQMLCTFSALHHNSVNVVIVWTTAGGAAIEAGMAYLLTGKPLGRESRMALALGFGAGGVLEQGKASFPKLAPKQLVLSWHFCHSLPLTR